LNRDEITIEEQGESPGLSGRMASGSFRWVLAVSIRSVASDFRRESGIRSVAPPRNHEAGWATSKQSDRGNSPRWGIGDFRASKQADNGLLFAPSFTLGPAGRRGGMWDPKIVEKMDMAREGIFAMIHVSSDIHR
jgi:hypothetical protein